MASFDGVEDEVRAAPKHVGTLRLIVRRPDVDRREIVHEAHLDTGEGLIGDNWRTRGSSRTPDGSANPDAQVTVMSAQVAGAVAGDIGRWALAGDQLYVDLDLSEENLPAGARLRIGDAEIEVSATPHTGCAKFSGRFGKDALQLVSTPVGRSLRLRGLNARVTKSGTVRVGGRIEVSSIPAQDRVGKLDLSAGT